jgi:hypothetical protein
VRLLAVADRLRQHWASHAAAVGLTPAQVKVCCDSILTRLSRCAAWPGDCTTTRLT